MTTPDAPGRAARAVTVSAVLLVAAVAAVVSYAHMREVAERAGEAWRALLLPLSVDGLVVAASMVLLTRRRTGLPGGMLAWSALLGGVGASLAANVAAAEPTVTARTVAAWPALAFAVTFELLLSQRRMAVIPSAGPAPDHARQPDHGADQAGQLRPVVSPTDLDLAAELAAMAATQAGRSGETDQAGPLPDHDPTAVPDQSDDDPTLLADLRRWASGEPDRPSRNAVMGRYGIGATRANRLLDGLPRTGTGPAADHGPDRGGPAPDHEGEATP